MLCIYMNSLKTEIHMHGCHQCSSWEKFLGTWESCWGLCDFCLCLEKLVASCYTSVVHCYSTLSNMFLFASNSTNASYTHLAHPSCNIFSFLLNNKIKKLLLHVIRVYSSKVSRTITIIIISQAQIWYYTDFNVHTEPHQ